MVFQFKFCDREKRRKSITSLIDRLKKEYSPITPSSISNIAKEVGGVRQVIRTPLVGDKSRLLYGQDGHKYIFYWPELPRGERFNLAHETGYAVLHLEVEGKPIIKQGFQFEMEVDLFATQLCGIPRLLPYFYQLTLVNFVSYGTKARNLFRRDREIERLKDLGVYDVLVYNDILKDERSKDA